MYISLDNGHSYLTAGEAVADGKFNMAALAQIMDDELREMVHSELAPCTDREYLERYTELAACDLIIG